MSRSKVPNGDPLPPKAGARPAGRMGDFRPNMGGEEGRVPTGGPVS